MSDWSRLDPHRRRVVLLWSVRGGTVAARVLHISRQRVYQHLAIARRQVGVEDLQQLKSAVLQAHLDIEVC